MDAPALTGSILVHGAAILASLFGSGVTARHAAERPPIHAIAPLAITEPRLLVFTNPHAARADPAPDRAGPITGPGCAPASPVLLDATPNFPVSGPDEPLAWLRELPRSPAFCARIGTDGRIAAIRLSRSSGDPSADAAILATLRTLPFRPAYIGARPAAAWHQVVVRRFPSRP